MPCSLTLTRTIMVVLSEVCRRGDPLQRSQNHSANDFTGARLFACRMRGHLHRFVRLSKVPNTTYNIDSQVHLKPDNILVKIEDPAILDRDARDEYLNPLPQKVTDNGWHYLSFAKRLRAVFRTHWDNTDYRLRFIGVGQNTTFWMYSSRSLPRPRSDS